MLHISAFARCVNSQQKNLLRLKAVVVRESFEVVMNGCKYSETSGRDQLPGVPATSRCPLAWVLVGMENVGDRQTGARTDEHIDERGLGGSWTTKRERSWACWVDASAVRWR